MLIDRFQSRMSKVYIALMIFPLMGFFWNLHERTIIDFFIVVGLGILIVLLFYFDYKYTYLEIGSSNNILNRQGTTKDIFKASDIVYIGRIYFRRSHTAILYYKGLNNVLEHSFLFETAYSKNTFQNILKHLATLNPEIEFSDKYNDLLQSEVFDLGYQVSADSRQKIRKKLEAQGFKVRPVSWWEV